MKSVIHVGTMRMVRITQKCLYSINSAACTTKTYIYVCTTCINNVIKSYFLVVGVTKYITCIYVSVYVFIDHTLAHVYSPGCIYYLYNIPNTNYFRKYKPNNRKFNNYLLHNYYHITTLNSSL